MSLGFVHPRPLGGTSTQVLLPRLLPPPFSQPKWVSSVDSSPSAASGGRDRRNERGSSPEVLPLLGAAAATASAVARGVWGRRRGAAASRVALAAVEGKAIAAVEGKVELRDERRHLPEPPDLVEPLQNELAYTPERQMVRKINRYEDPDDPSRPPPPLRDRRALWAPPGPFVLGAPEVLVVGLGRRLRADEADGPRARLGAGAVEALQRRYQVRTFFDVDQRGYVATCRASLDKTGRAGVQKINFLQPVVERGNEVAHAMEKTMARPGFDEAMVLFVLSDHRLPFGQLRMRNAYNDSDPRLRSAYATLGPGNRVTCLYVGAGEGSPSKELLAAEAAALPQVLNNAATAIEVWLSEADLGLVMRFVNRPEVYEMPLGWPYTHQVLEAPESGEAKADEQEAIAEDDQSRHAMDLYEQGSLEGPGSGEYALFDLNRDNATDIPDVVPEPMTQSAALAALEERPPDVEALCVAGRRYMSFTKLQKSLVHVLLDQKPGRHLRLQDDEDAMKALLSFHPDADRLLEDLVAVKVDVSPIDDDTRCLWVVKFDGYEEDVSLRTCLEGLKQYLRVEAPAAAHSGPAKLAATATIRIPRLGPGRWKGGLLRETTFDRARQEELRGRDANI